MPFITMSYTDWFRIIADLTSYNVTLHDIAKTLDVALSTVSGWRKGSEPRHVYGIALIELWRQIPGNEDATPPIRRRERHFQKYGKPKTKSDTTKRKARK